jgi:hypothetical protein
MAEKTSEKNLRNDEMFPEEKKVARRRIFFVLLALDFIMLALVVWAIIEQVF